MAKLNNKLREYVMAETKGHSFPTTPMPNFRDFCKEVAGGIRWYKRQKLILKTIINAIDLFPPTPMTPEEKEDLAMLIANGQNPVGDKKYAQAIVRRDRFSKTPLVILIIAGRGAGKSTMAGVIIGYVIRFLIWLQDPHKFFGLGKFKPISIQMLAGKEGQAIALFQIAKSVVRRCKDLRGTYEELQGKMEFGGVVEAQAFTTNADSVRGYDTFLYYHEECAFCGENTPESMKSFTQVEKAIRPAVLNRFRENGIELFVTSAGAKQGNTYKIYKRMKDGSIKNCIMFQLAAWEIGNPHFPSKASFEEDYMIDNITAEAEQGAQFVDAMNTFLSEAEVTAPLKTGRVKQQKGQPAVQYWIRIDPSRRHDRYALALGHKEYRTVGEHEKIVAVVDYITWWEPKWLDKDGNQVSKLSPGQKARLVRDGGECIPVNAQDVLAHVEALCQEFNVMGVSADQFESGYIIDELQDRYGTEEYDFGRVKPINEMNNWLAYRLHKKLVNTNCLEYYDEPMLLDELRALMRYNKNKPLESSEVYESLDEESGDNDEPRLMYSVEAPKTGPVRTDDIADAVVFLEYDMMTNMDLAPARLDSLKAGGIRDSAVVLDNPKNIHSPLSGMNEVWK